MSLSTAKFIVDLEGRRGLGSFSKGLPVGFFSFSAHAENGEDAEFVRAKYFFRDQFLVRRFDVMCLLLII